MNDKFIFFIEEDAAARLLLESQLTAVGCRVALAAAEEAAFKRIRAHPLRTNLMLIYLRRRTAAEDAAIAGSVLRASEFRVPILLIAIDYEAEAEGAEARAAGASYPVNCGEPPGGVIKLLSRLLSKAALPPPV